MKGNTQNTRLMLAQPVITGVRVRTMASSWGLTVVVLLAISFSNKPVFATEDTFQPPKAYPAERYEAGWNMNPFTLKTAPVALAKASFAEDLAIGSYFGSKDNPTVVVVNTKTGERTSLRVGEAASNGMKLKTVTLKPSRKDVVAEVTLAEQSAILHFSEAYLRQVTAPPDDKAKAHDAKTASSEKAPGGSGQVSQAPDPRRKPPKGSAAEQMIMAASSAHKAASLNAANANIRETPGGHSSKGPPSSTMRRLQTAPVRPVGQPIR